MHYKSLNKFYSEIIIAVYYYKYLKLSILHFLRKENKGALYQKKNNFICFLIKFL